MRCRAWETRHQNGKTYIHIVDERLEVEYIKDIAERVARSPLSKECVLPVHRDVAGSYLVADKGNESIGFGAFVSLDSHILVDLINVKEGLEELVRGNIVQAQAISLLFEKLKIEKKE